MKKYEVFYSDADGQQSVVVEAENFHAAKQRCPKKSKSGRPLCDKIEEVGADAELTDWTLEDPEDLTNIEDPYVPVETQTAGDSGEAAGDDVAAAGSDAPADAEPAAGGDTDEGSAVGAEDPQGGGV